MSKHRYLLERAAIEDLEESIDFLRGESAAVPHRFLDACYETFELIADYPGIGRVYESLNPMLGGFRVFRVKHFERWLIFYRERRQIVQIERVIHSARDIPGLLSEP